jgi:hypothetical protein
MYRELKKLNSQRINNPLNYGQTILKRRNINVLGHKGNANQNHIEIPPHPSQNGCHRYHKQQRMLARM